MGFANGQVLPQSNIILIMEKLPLKYEWSKQFTRWGGQK